MSTEDVLNAIQEENPVLLAKIAMAIRMTEAIDEDFAADTAASIDMVAQYATEKVAAGGWADWGRGMAAMGASTLAGSLASDLYDVAKRGLTSSGNFRRIVDSNEQLQGYEKKDVKRAFDTLHRFAPEFTADPSVGGQIIHRMIEAPHDQHNIIKDFLAARNNLRNIRKAQFSMGPVHYEAPAMEMEQAKHELAKKLETHKAQNALSNQKTMHEFKGTKELQEAQEKMREAESAMKGQRQAFDKEMIERRRQVQQTASALAGVVKKWRVGGVMPGEQMDLFGGKIQARGDKPSSSNKPSKGNKP